jgi:hypothetical protein
VEEGISVRRGKVAGAPACYCYVLRSSGSGAEASAPVRRGPAPGEEVPGPRVRGSGSRGPLGPTRQGQRVHGASLPRVAGRVRVSFHSVLYCRPPLHEKKTHSVCFRSASTHGNRAVFSLANRAFAKPRM